MFEAGKDIIWVIGFGIVLVLGAYIHWIGKKMLRDGNGEQALHQGHAGTA